ncbi:MAG TPA: M28 family peptidase, partial [Bryobacteraceae bacterium]|nr:M28 family peptidase [Bryobacteraceae bacterium]
DDGSGTAAVMELARVMSRYQFDKTLVFAAFAGEEQGLIGSSLEAAKAHKENETIEAVLNNDIIGTDQSGNGRFGNTSVNVYSDETMDSPSQQLSRYVREIAERYIPAMKVDTIFMGDRLGRGGDHTPFQWEGYAAVRLSTPNEIYANQHHATDLLENMSVPYTAKVARVNGVVAASLALSPKAPNVMRQPPPPRAWEKTDGPTPPLPRRPTPMISRGKSGYDALLQWKPAGPDTAIKGYAIVIRPTTSPYWEQEIYVGKVTEYLMKDVSIDDMKFGVKAIGVDGGESLVAPYVYPPRAKTEIQTVQ